MRLVCKQTNDIMAPPVVLPAEVNNLLYNCTSCGSKLHNVINVQDKRQQIKCLPFMESSAAASKTKDKDQG